ncbi:MAG TPA: hypothetical protein ENO21_00615, partial [Firmicutes bacterium]|nr:hypothetical protein [Bacillota bacterium]
MAGTNVSEQQKRRRRTVAWIVAGAVVLVIAGGAWYGHVQNTYRPTGDALFDQFATRALAEMPRYSALQELGFDWFNPQQYAYADLMPVVKNMEQDWGGDPRYWQLRWLTQQWSFVQSSTDSETQNVIDAIERGVVDENSYGAISYDSLYNTDPALALRYIGKAIDAQD